MVGGGWDAVCDRPIILGTTGGTPRGPSPTKVLEGELVMLKVREVRLTGVVKEAPPETALVKE